MFDLMGKTCRELISAEKIATRVRELGAQITRDHKEHGRDLVLVGVMKGSVIFLADLCRHIELPCTLELIGIASYGDETVTSGVVQITSDLSKPIENKDVIIVEDIIDTGLTVHYLLDNFKTRAPKSVKVAALLHKPDRSLKQVGIDYLGFSIPNEFVVGYGLDYAQRYRNLPFIGVVEGTG
jgi:hypoxanthine phosphoribosyltransferase